MKKYTYDAFISYRHSELDKFVAENIHRQLEAFRLPGNLARERREGRTRITRVFRDKDELPLTSNLEDPIRQALEDSEYLIVICSPRLRESLWCQKEIETFIALHGRAKVFAVLAEGEPEDSFPKELLSEEITVQNPDGTYHTSSRALEPLAADVRGRNRKAVKKAMKTEVLRLLAPMFSVGFDDLKQRHRERRLKHFIAAAAAIGGICLGFGMFSTAMALRIQNQKEQIEAQNEALLEHQAEGLADQSFRELNAGDRLTALHTAVSALSEYEGSKMPYTAKAQYALTESLHVYDNGDYIKPKHQFQAEGIICEMHLSENWELLAAYDTSNCISLWNIASGECMAQIRDVDYGIGAADDFAFLGNDRLAYVNCDDEVCIYDIAAKETTKPFTYQNVYSLYADDAGKLLLLKEYDGLVLLDTAAYKECINYATRNMIYDIQFAADGSMLAFEEGAVSEILSGDRQLHFWELENFTEYPPIQKGNESLEEVRYKDGIAYALFNNLDSGYTHLESILSAYRLASSELLWESRFDSFGSGVMRPYAEGADTLLVLTTFEGHLIHMADGTEQTRFPFGSETAGSAAYLNTDRYMVFLRNGEFHIADAGNGQDFNLDYQFLCHSQNVREFEPAAAGYLVLPYGDNSITFYQFSTGPDVTEYGGETVRPQENCLEIRDAAAFAEEQGIAKAALAKDVFFNEDKSLFFVYYTDRTMEIYDNQDGSLICTLKDLKDELNQYVGEDAAGNMYIAGLTHGYMLNQDYEVIAVIEGLVAVDKEENRLIMEKSDGTLCTAPIYTVKELLAMAEK